MAVATAAAPALAAVPPATTAGLGSGIYAAALMVEVLARETGVHSTGVEPSAQKMR